MRRAALILLVLGALALVASGCGGGQKRTIPTAKGQSFLTQLDNIGGQFDSQSCSGARSKVIALEAEARALSSRVDPDVKSNLVTGLQRLEALVVRDCQRPTPTNTTPAPTVPTNTGPTTPTNTGPTTTPTNTGPTTPTGTTPPPTTPPPTTTPGGGVTVPGTTGAGGAQLNPGGTTGAGSG